MQVDADRNECVPEGLVLDVLDARCDERVPLEIIDARTPAPREAVAAEAERQHAHVGIEHGRDRDDVSAESAWPPENFVVGDVDLDDATAVHRTLLQREERAQPGCDGNGHRNSLRWMETDRGP